MKHRTGFLIVTLILALHHLSGCGGGGGSESPVARNVLYVKSNLATVGENSILAYLTNVNGTMSFLGSYKTGGTGVSDSELDFNSKTLKSDNIIIVNQARTRLYAVNQGLDTIVAFNILLDGSLSPVPGSPFNSGGKAPASLALIQKEASSIVVNYSLDGKAIIPPGGLQPPTQFVSANLSSLAVHSDGSLGQAKISLSSSEIDVQSLATSSQDGFSVFSSDRMWNYISKLKYEVGNTTTPSSFIHKYVPSEPANDYSAQLSSPLGICVNPVNQYVYVALTQSRNIAVYQSTNDNLFNYVGKSAQADHYACLLTVNLEGTRLYSSNAVTGDVSVLDIATDPFVPKIVQTVNVTGIEGSLSMHGNLWNLKLDPAGKFLYVSTPRHFYTTPSGEGNTLHVFAVDPTGKLLEVPNSTVSLNLSPTANSQGLVVL